MRYLEGKVEAECYRDVEQHLEDVTNGKTVIYYSAFSLLEIRPSFLHGAGYGTFDDFAADHEGTFLPVEVTPDILQWCGVVREIKYPNPNGGKDRVLTAGDAVQLMSAVWVREVAVPDLVFHTFDDGKGRNVESDKEPTVSLLQFEKFVEGIPTNPHTPRICAMPRSKPFHPSLKLDV